MDFSSVSGKVVIVTGASRGIGEAIARCYADHGMRVVCANRDPVKGQQVVESIKASGGDALYCKTDASKPDEVKALVDFTMENYRRLDGIVNNSGIGMGGTPLHENTIEDCERILDLNLKGVFAGMKYGAEAIFKSKSEGGFIINIASIAGLMPQSGMGLYVATKQGVVGMTRSAAMEYAPYNLTVNAICPGHTLTSMYDVAPAEAMELFTSQIPAGRMGKPEECAWLALFLASDMARFITGAAIPVDGGIAAGQRNILMWRHPELVGMGDGKLNSDSTIAAIMEVPEGAAIVERYLPGFSENEQAKMAYGLTFKALCEIPATGISKEKAEAFFKELDTLSE
ncbi:MAG: SDR family oxidoreductase [Clostridiaceae bacterium]|nr:SDR family oxidoreductase [Clostridiaceae bacterium]